MDGGRIFSTPPSTGDEARLGVVEDKSMQKNTIKPGRKWSKP